MSFGSDASYLPEAEGFAVFMLIKPAGPPSGWMRGWWGFGNFDLPADAIDTTGGIYRGNNYPLDFSTLELVVNGQTKSIELTFSGLTGRAALMTPDQRQAIYNAPLHVGLQNLDGYGQRAGAMAWLQYGVCGWPRWMREGQDQPAITTTIPVLLGAHDRNDTTVDYWSPNSQHLRRAGDRMFDQVDRMSIGQMINWPQSS